MSNIKENMKINDEFLYLFDKPQNKSFNRKSSKKNKKKEIVKDRKQENFKDNIMVFIEPHELHDIQKLLDIVDKIKRERV